MRVQTDGTIPPLAALEDAVKKARGRYERLRSVVMVGPRAPLAPAAAPCGD